MLNSVVLGACSNIQVTLNSNATQLLELGSATANTLHCNISYGYSCCNPSGHLNVTWYKDDIAINSNPAFSTSGTYLSVSSFGTYYSTLSFNGSGNVTHNGAYKCAVKVLNKEGNTYGPVVSGSVNVTVTVKSKSYKLITMRVWGLLSENVFLTVPQPSVFLTGGSVTVGSTATLQCNVTLQQYTSYLSTPNTLTVVLLKGTAALLVDSYPTGSGSVHTSVFTIPNVGVSNAGQYQCRATVRTTQNNLIDSSPGVSNTANLTIQSNLQYNLC